jgi:hypothetical protein
MFYQHFRHGSQCSVEILTDIPVDTDPNRFFNVSNGSPGHTFLQIRKSNGAQSVSQNIGFYPNQGWKTMLNPSPLGSKVVDNGNHEFNASLKRQLTAEQLKNMLSLLQYKTKNSHYDIDDYNCTDFALDVFNSVANSGKLEIPKFNIPIGINPASTPQGLFQKLKSMKDSGVESNNINIPGVKGWVANSSGPCN